MTSSLPIVLDAIVKSVRDPGGDRAGRRVLRRASASARHFVWTLGLLSALVAPAFSLALPRWELPIVGCGAAVPDGEHRAPACPRHPKPHAGAGVHQPHYGR